MIRHVVMWSFKEEEARRIIEEKEHKEFLPGIKISDTLKVVTSPEEAVKGADIIINAIPSKFIRVNMEKFVPFVKKEQFLCAQYYFHILNLTAY